MRLFNFKSNTIEEIDDSQVEGSISSGGFGFLKDERVSVENEMGETGTLPARQALEVIKNPESGWRFIGDRERTNRKINETYGTTPQKIIGGVEAVTSGMTAGLSELVEDVAGVDREGVKGRRQALGMAGTGLEVLGSIAPFTKAFQAVKGASKIAAPMLAIDRLGMGASNVVKALGSDQIKNKIIKKGLEFGVRGGVEGGAFNAVNYLSESAMGDVSFNSEAMISRMTDGMKLGGAFGVVAGAGTEAAAKAFMTSKSKVASELRKFAGVADGEKGQRVSVNPKKIKMSDHTMDVGGKAAVFSYDPKTNSYVYTDNLRRIELDSEKLTGKILDISDVSEMDNLGRHVDVPGLGSVIDEWDMDKETLVSFIAGKKSENAIANSHVDFNMRVGNTEKKEKLATAYNKFRKEKFEISKKIARGEGSAKDTKRIAKLDAGMVKVKKGFKRLGDEINESFKKAGVKRKGSINDEVMTALDEYSSVKMGDEFYIKNLDSIDNAVKRAVSIKDKRGAAKLEYGDLQTLKLAGAEKKYFRKKYRAGKTKEMKELADFIKSNFRNKSNQNFINHPVLTDLDDLMENVGMSELEAINMIDEAINHAENLISEKGMATNITGAKLADYIDTAFYSKMKDPKSGRITPVFDGAAPSVAKFSDKLRGFRTDPRTGSQIPFTVRELRDFRITLDKFPGLDFDGNQAISKEMIKGLRTRIEEMVVGNVEKLGDIKTRELYEAGKKKYGLAQETFSILENRFASESKNNTLSLTGYISAGAGASAFGGVGGAIVGLAGRELGRSYGSNFLALYADRVGKSAEKLSRKITKTSKGFLKSGDKVLFTPAVKAVSKKSLQEKWKEDTENVNSGKYDPEYFADQYMGANQGFILSLPETSNAIQSKMMNAYVMLGEKIPKDPYGDGGFRDYFPPDMALRKFERYKAAIKDVNHILKEIESGLVTNESVEVLRRIYPETYKVLQAEIISEMSKNKNITYKKRQMIGKVFGVKVDLSQRNRNYLMSLEKRNQKGKTDTVRKQSRGAAKRKNLQTEGQRVLE